MREHLSAALSYAKRGWPLFPLHGIVNGRCTCGRDCGSPGKHPLVRRGLYEATTEPRVIKEWWSRWRRANIGIATGERSGFIVVDIDLPTALGSLDVVVHKVPKTLAALTGGGGIHLLLRAPADRSVHNHASRLPGIDRDLPGIDLRGDGGYVVAAPSVHISGNRYTWLERADDVEDPYHRDQHCEAESHSLDQSNGVFGHGFTITTALIAPAPAWLREPPRRPIVIARPRFRDGDGTSQGVAALRKQLDILSRAREGERNHTLNRCAFIVGLFIGCGHLDETTARSALHATALRTGLRSGEIARTTDSAVGAGVRLPRVAPHRLRP